jgi:hypothetical protein
VCKKQVRNESESNQIQIRKNDTNGNKSIQQQVDTTTSTTAATMPPPFFLPIDTWSSFAPLVLKESQDAGCTNTLFSETKEAAVQWAIMNPSHNHQMQQQNKSESEAHQTTTS